MNREPPAHKQTDPAKLPGQVTAPQVALPVSQEPVGWLDQYGSFERSLKPWMQDEARKGVEWRPVFYTSPQVAQPVAWLTSEPDGNDGDGSYGGMREGVELGAERPEFGTVPLYTAPQVAQQRTSCRACGGLGVDWNEGDPCHACGGSGRQGGTP